MPTKKRLRQRLAGLRTRPEGSVGMEGGVSVGAWEGSVSGGEIRSATGGDAGRSRHDRRRVWTSGGPESSWVKETSELDQWRQRIEDGLKALSSLNEALFPGLDRRVNPVRSDHVVVVCGMVERQPDRQDCSSTLFRIESDGASLSLGELAGDREPKPGLTIVVTAIPIVGATPSSLKGAGMKMWRQPRSFVSDGDPRPIANLTPVDAHCRSLRRQPR